MKEADVLRAVQDYLQAKGILCFRNNTGAMKTEYGFMRFGTPGMADLIAYPHVNGQPYPVWLECKTEKGRQSPLQKSFEDMVLNRGHKYFVIKSVDDLIYALKSLA